MSRHCHFLAPAPLATRTGGYVYDRRIVDGLRERGWSVSVHALGNDFPAPGAASLQRAAETFAAIPDDALVVADGLAFGALPALARQHARRLRILALVHHPLALETGLDADRRQALRISEREALEGARAVVVTSAATAAALDAYGVPASRVTVVEPGVDAAPLASGSGPDASSTLLCVATVTPRKGHAVLVEALAGLRGHAWTLNCAGSLTMDPDCAGALQACIAHHALGGRIRLLGEQDDAALAGWYDRADLFVLPSFHEGYGMVLTEALARGLPIVASRAGAIADTVPGDAGLLVPPGDARALRAALQAWFEAPGLRERLAGGARRARERLRPWADSVGQFAGVLDRLGGAEEAA